jgi:hypothetical protein
MRHLPILRRPWWAWLCAAGAIALMWYPSPLSPFRYISDWTFALAVLSLVVAGWVPSGGHRSAATEP